MHIIRGLFQAITIMALAGVLFVTVPPVHATGTTFVVNTNINIAGDLKCSLEEAIKAGNQTTGGEDCLLAGSTTDPDIIHFNLPVGQQTITLANQQTISGPLILDGTSQPGYAGTPIVHITGTLSYMFWFTSSGGGSTVRGLRFSNARVSLDCIDGYGNALFFNGSSNNVVAGNYIHTNGTRSLSPCGRGVWIAGTSNNNTIGGSTAADRNLFGGVAGIEVGTGTGNTVEGNYFGVKTTGNARLNSLTNTEAAIMVGSYSGSVDATVIRGNVIGGYQTGIYLYAYTFPSSNTHVVGNKIGVGADGTSLVSNEWGINLVGTADNTIGGTAAADRNIISGNTTVGVSVSGNSARNLILGNFIGTDAAGLHAVVPASPVGITVSGSSETTIGGVEPGSGNVISGNADGIDICCTAASTTILGNKIGTDKNGARAIPNSNGIVASSVGVNIGDAVTPGNNLISGNGNSSPSFYGIYLLNTPVGTTIYGNKIGLSSAGETAIPNGTGIALNGSAHAVIWGNWIARSTNDGVYIDSTSSVGTSSQNCFTGNVVTGVNNINLASAPFPGNWWGRVSGPTGAGGTGDAIQGVVDTSGFLAARADACANRVSNSSFETDADHNSKPDNWTYTGFNTSTDKRDCSVRKAGTCSLELAGNRFQKTAAQTILYSGLAGEDIGFTVWSKASSVPAGSVYQLQMKVYNGTTLVDTKTANFLKGTHDFQQVAIRYTARDNYDKVVVMIIFKAASGTAWFDMAFHGWAP